MEIAKLRAARLLWAQIVKAYNPENEDSAKWWHIAKPIRSTKRFTILM